MSKITHTLEKRETFIYNHGQPTRAHETHNAHQTPTGPGKPRARSPGPASAPYPHHHHRHVVCGAPLHRLGGQPVAGGFVAGVHGGLPFPALDLLVLRGGRGCWSAGAPAPPRQHRPERRDKRTGPPPGWGSRSPRGAPWAEAALPLTPALPWGRLTSRQDKMKWTASSGVKTLKRPSQASKINLQRGEETSAARSGPRGPL